MHTKLRLIAEVDTHVIEDDPGDGSPYSGYRETRDSIRVEGLLIEGLVNIDDPADAYDSDTICADFPIAPGAPLWLVLVEYHDGGTFGSSSYHHCAGLFQTRDEARERVRSIKDGSFKTGDYTPWDGYFAGIDDVREHLVITVSK